MEESDSAVFCTQGSRTSQFAEQDTPRFSFGVEEKSRSKQNQIQQIVRVYQGIRGR